MDEPDRLMCLHPERVHVIDAQMFEDYSRLCGDGIYPQVNAWDLECDREISDARCQAEVSHWSAMKAFGRSLACTVFALLEIDGERFFIESGRAEPLDGDPYEQLFGIVLEEGERSRLELRPEPSLAL
ncbi:MAG: hypothetical protein V2J24_06730 [Pseudomonadales bacterium]|jgi:hypothetical protein|nr:hypothetical protein [Pseudomonadales bacterium]